ncbi:hypothetical protein DIE02_01960 [Burkholderia sp. Bp8991]|nr:hypothetical protein DIE02_01960 [Burkholderia sp. Bp8991]
MAAMSAMRIGWAPITSTVIDSVRVVRSTSTLQRHTFMPFFARHCQTAMTFSLPKSARIESLSTTIAISL